MKFKYLAAAAAVSLFSATVLTACGGTEPATDTTEPDAGEVAPAPDAAAPDATAPDATAPDAASPSPAGAGN